MLPTYNCKNLFQAALVLNLGQFCSPGHLSVSEQIFGFENGERGATGI